MIDIPLYFIAIPFLILYGIWAIFVFFNIYHTLRFGYINYISYFMTFLLLGAIVITVFAGYDALRDVDWNQNITFDGGKAQINRF